MTGYSIALFFHLLSLLLAVVCTSLTGYAALRARTAASADEARQWLGLNRRVVTLFPAAGLGLLLTGGYMAHSIAAWSEPWLITSLTGLGCIVVLGAGVEGSRSRALGRELHANGLSDRARALARDPVAWSAKLLAPALMLAVIFIITNKPTAAGSVIALSVAAIAGVAAALPFWGHRERPARQAALNPRPTFPTSEKPAQ